MTAPQTRVLAVAALGILALVGGDALAVAAPKTCGPGLPSLSEQAVLDSETPLPLSAWADLNGGKGRGSFAVNYEGVGHGVVEVDSVDRLRHGDLDGDGDRDTVGTVLAHPVYLNEPDRPRAGRGLAMLVIWRNDNGKPVPLAGRVTGEEPRDVTVALDRGLITFGYTALDPQTEPGNEERRVDTKLFLRLRGPALTEVSDPNAVALDLGPFATSRGGHGRTLEMRPDGTWTHQERTYGGPADAYYREITGRVVARNGDTATVRVDGRPGTETWTYDAANDAVSMGDHTVVCGSNSPVGWCGA